MACHRMAIQSVHTPRGSLNACLCLPLLHSQSSPSPNTKPLGNLPTSPHPSHHTPVQVTMLSCLHHSWTPVSSRLGFLCLICSSTLQQVLSIQTMSLILISPGWIPLMASQPSYDDQNAHCGHPNVSFSPPSSTLPTQPFHFLRGCPLPPTSAVAQAGPALCTSVPTNLHQMPQPLSVQ